MNQTQQQSIPYSIPNAVQTNPTSIPPVFPNDTLIRDFKGEVLVVQTGAVIEVFDLNQEIGPMMESRRFITSARYRNACYLVGSMTPTGGRFRSITRKEAIGRFGKWLFEVV